MRPIRRCSVPAAVLLLAATGCGGHGTADSTPSASVTPIVIVTPSDPAKDPEYLAAVEVYKKYFAEMQKFEAAGYPTRTLPASMDQYITGDLKSAVQQSIDAAYAAHLAPQMGSSSTLTALAPNPGVSKAQSVTSIRVCVDGRAAVIVNRKTHAAAHRGVLAYKEVFFKRFDGQLKAFDQDAKRVEKCPF